MGVWIVGNGVGFGGKFGDFFSGCYGGNIVIYG